ncbi:MAG: DNA polymerase III subunit gamma/tau [Clostridiaceae bacterium]|nr:DNA polymerase III subunit gamma/tau [Clostridiaceae bacterium]
MSYMALYREWRPLVFDDVVEQEHIVKSLKYSVKTGRIAHAYLFCGTRGTGKTTMAQIFSRAINCREPDNGNPCNKCDICRGILSGSILDVMEIDAASNNSVDNIRDIRDEVIYSPSHAKYKVYIIDEVHMLSTGAFNALLKTLEEPPSHVVFILATTEPHKLPATILSRCQRYDFRRITAAGIAKRLRRISAANGIEVEDRAIRLIASISEGALRDALSILDQCISLGSSKITYSDVLSITGTANEQLVSAFLNAIIKRDIGGILMLVNQLVMEGKDIAQFIASLISYCRNLLVCKMVEDTRDIEDILDVSGESLETIKSQAACLGKEDIVHIINELSGLESNLKWSNHPRVMLEVALIKICTKTAAAATAIAEGTGPEQELQKAGNGVYPGQASLINPESPGNRLKAGITDNQDNPGTLDDLAKAGIPDADCITEKHDSDNINLNEIWDETLKELGNAGKTVLCVILRKAEIIKLNPNCIGIVLPGNEGVNKKIVSQASNIKLIEEILKDKLGGRDVRVKCLTEKDLGNAETLNPGAVKGETAKGCQNGIPDDKHVKKMLDFAATLNAPFNVCEE